ncbi:S1 family peptidase [Streptomyces corynorhini]|uniref:S1 family peptidase n=1 Tax=Streptomyces corynorhini TaxID=2282652 RepID=A0A370B7F5_9ACTN|nr:S1 family peptidase [Streptomyces corynorhini]RDG35676.1 S1 family peptidase [Streptomyces corynorhini]
MRHARRTFRRIARLAAVGGLICGGLMVSNAVAGEAEGREPGGADGGASASAELGASLVSRLGDARTAGTWIAADGRPVVAVTDEDAADEVRRAGARAEVMRYSMGDLRTATATLREAPRVPGTAWAVDYATNQVVVHADSSVSAADWSALSQVAEGVGGSVRMERTEGSFTTRLDGASPIFNGAGRCSAGFNVTDGRENFLLTAGHCGPVGTTWFQDEGRGGEVGTTIERSFPGDDYSLVRYGSAGGGSATGDNGRSGVVDIGGGQGVRITGVADPVVGQQVFRSGSTTGLRTGRVTALNATVNYREGAVTGLIQTTVCAEPGDSGGPLLAQGIALGVTSGGTGDCTAGGVTFFQPMTTALSALGVSLVVDDGAGDGGGERGDGGDGSQAADTPASSPATTDPDGARAVLPPVGGAATPGGPGGTTVTGIVDFKSLVPGLGIIAASLLLLMTAHWILSERAGRSRYRSQYAQSWG